MCLPRQPATYTHQDTGKQIFFELYQFRTVGFANTESCRFGGYVVEGN